jgi:hypothetical protein
LADLHVVGGDCGDVLDVLPAFDGNRELLDLVDDRLRAEIDAALSSIGLAPAARLRRPSVTIA